MADIVLDFDLQLLRASLSSDTARSQFEKSIATHQPGVVSVVELKDAFPPAEALQVAVERLTATTEYKLPKLDPLYGGREEVAQSIVGRLSSSSSCRVFSLVADGGLGKSSIALDVAWRMLKAGNLPGGF